MFQKSILCILKLSTNSTVRLGILDGMDYISTMFGTYISGPMFESGGYYAIFSTSLIFATLGVLYMIIFVKEGTVTFVLFRQFSPWTSCQIWTVVPLDSCPPGQLSPRTVGC